MSDGKELSAALAELRRQLSAAEANAGAACRSTANPAQPGEGEGSCAGDVPMPTPVLVPSAHVPGVQEQRVTNLLQVRKGGHLKKGERGVVVVL